MLNLPETPYRYGFHLSPKMGWLNDPNGLCWFKGNYHVFYQTNPFDNRPGNIFWGHFVSEDLINWQQAPYAIVPEQDYDENGCYSGSALVVKDRLYLMYTGHKNLESGYVETQCIAVSDDGFNFRKLVNNPVIDAPPSDNTNRFRDPKLLFENGKFYAVIGGESEDNTGQVNVFDSESIEAGWQFNRKLIKAKKGDGIMWECPDLFELDGRKFLLTSPKEMMDQGINGFSSIWIESDFNEEQVVTDYQIHKIDDGRDFYAPQTFWDPINERRVMFAWFGLPGLQEQENNSQVGALTLPREIVIRSNRLCFPPIKELTALRMEERTIDNKMTINEKSELLIRPEIENGKFKIRLNSSDCDSFMEITYVANKLVIEIKDFIRKATVDKTIFKINEIRLFLDRGLTEIFINEGESVFSNKCELHGELELSFDGRLQGKVFDLKETIYD
ncbi:beta-fructofuranosidase [Enterococcus sp. DIV2402]|uniref:beta-fructofuranosidase n=1 Tax=Candidatus Enterococcus lowellii TaxID=2230877 RepID=A0ABZ2SL64_9ENTE|nr:glycoside hydrolase family 32 protein [Enterococcus sp. DIV2402]MBO0464585.1 glycoside hydrolase family 32 protein [Enterococcus sp. DIV2402]